MQILFLNPYHSGSHAAVAEGYAARSHHDITLFTLSSHGGWRWRMRGSAVTFARMARTLPQPPDLIIATDMLDLATFRALTRDLYGPHIPAALYFHENQLTYPLPPGRTRDLGFAWTNYTSALTADAIFFNSHFHQRTFLEALAEWLGHYHDYQEREQVEHIAARASVLAPGVDLGALGMPAHGDAGNGAGDNHSPVILWNGRWDYDKQPVVFFAALEALEQRGAAFQLIVAGEHVDPNAPEFVAARERWSHRLLHWGYAEDQAVYARLLHRADIVVSTAIQEFFGIGIIEALFCGCIPVLPHRLTYPELLPEAYHTDCLYTTPDDLVERLHQVLLRCAELRQYDWRAMAAPYDWAQMTAHYDAVFARVVYSAGSG